MNVFVSGGGGFLGGHLVQALKAAGHAVTAPRSAECDLRRPGALDRYSGVRFERIFHLAAWTQAGDFCLHHPGEQWIHNQQINTAMLAWWQGVQPQAKLIAIGSSCCYEPGSAHREDEFFKGIPTESLFTYGMTKRMLLAGLQALSRQFKLRYLFAIPSTLYGADYHLDGRQMHFIFDLVRKIVEAQREGPEVVLWGDGAQVRELVHVDDFAAALLALDARVDNEIVNIGAGGGHSIREFAAEICKLTGYDPAKIRYDTARYVGAKEKVLDTAKLKRLLPDLSLRPLSAGLRETVEWYQRATDGRR